MSNEQVIIFIDTETIEETELMNSDRLEEAL